MQNLIKKVVSKSVTFHERKHRIHALHSPVVLNTEISMSCPPDPSGSFKQRILFLKQHCSIWQQVARSYYLNSNRWNKTSNAVLRHPGHILSTQQPPALVAAVLEMTEYVHCSKLFGVGLPRAFLSLSVECIYMLWRKGIKGKWLPKVFLFLLIKSRVKKLRIPTPSPNKISGHY